MISYYDRSGAFRQAPVKKKNRDGSVIVVTADGDQKVLKHQIITDEHRIKLNLEMIKKERHGLMVNALMTRFAPKRHTTPSLDMLASGNRGFFKEVGPYLSEMPVVDGTATVSLRRLVSVANQADRAKDLEEFGDKVMAMLAWLAIEVGEEKFEDIVKRVFK